MTAEKADAKAYPTASMLLHWDGQYPAQTVLAPPQPHLSPERARSNPHC